MVTEETQEVVEESKPTTEEAATPAASDDSGTELAAKEEVDHESDSGAETEPEKPKFTPNYKLKVYDQEKELDPMFHSLIKDSDSEKKVKDVVEKSLALDIYKERHEKLKTDYSQYEQTTKPVVEYYNTASKMLQKGDLDSFFELIGIPKDTVYRYAVQKAQEAQLAPEQQQAIEYQRQIARQKEYLETQNQNLMTQSQQQLANFRSQELNWVLQRPDVAKVSLTFDEKNGPGAFRNLVRDKGLAHFAQTNGREDLSAEQAVSEVMKLVGAFVQPTNGTQPGTAPNGQLIQQNGQPPVIPNVQGRGTSPVRKKPTSIADLKKIREGLSSR